MAGRPDRRQVQHRARPRPARPAYDGGFLCLSRLCAGEGRRRAARRVGAGVPRRRRTAPDRRLRRAGGRAARRARRRWPGSSSPASSRASRGFAILAEARALVVPSRWYEVFPADRRRGLRARRARRRLAARQPRPRSSPTARPACTSSPTTPTDSRRALRRLRRRPRLAPSASARGPGGSTNSNLSAWRDHGERLLEIYSPARTGRTAAGARRLTAGGRRVSVVPRAPSGRPPRRGGTTQPADIAPFRGLVLRRAHHLHGHLLPLADRRSGHAVRDPKRHSITNYGP